MHTALSGSGWGGVTATYIQLLCFSLFLVYIGRQVRFCIFLCFLFRELLVSLVIAALVESLLPRER